MPIYTLTFHFEAFHRECSVSSHEVRKGSAGHTVLYANFHFYVTLEDEKTHVKQCRPLCKELGTVHISDPFIISLAGVCGWDATAPIDIMLTVHVAM